MHLTETWKKRKGIVTVLDCSTRVLSWWFFITRKYSQLQLSSVHSTLNTQSTVPQRTVLLWQLTRKWEVFCTPRQHSTANDCPWQSFTTNSRLQGTAIYLLHRWPCSTLNRATLSSTVHRPLQSVNTNWPHLMFRTQESTIRVTLEIICSLLPLLSNTTMKSHYYAMSRYDLGYNIVGNTCIILICWSLVITIKHKILSYYSLLGNVPAFS
jgi:hypothetical protein